MVALATMPDIAPMQILPFRPVLTDPALVASPDAFFAVVKEGLP